MQVRRVLTGRKVDFDEIFVDDDPGLQRKVIEMSRQNTVPVFVHPDGRVEVGFEGETG
ncbi:MAG: glutaredoxin [Armatimonadetes bacterium]|nr:glutaredoxin [Armatimonadota bacterium]